MGYESYEQQRVKEAYEVVWKLRRELAIAEAELEIAKAKLDLSEGGSIYDV